MAIEHTEANLPATAPALEFRNVRHAYGEVVAVDGLSLVVERGETVCLLGPSGCGKTTALRLAAGLETPQRGEIWMGGSLAAGQGVFRPPEERRVGLVFQDYALFPHLSIEDNIAFGLDGMSAADRRIRVREVLEEVGMEGYATAFPHMLSGGQQQRIALARALAPRPDVVLLDEPFSGLDARLRDAVRDRTLHALKRSGTSALMVTHDAEEAMYLADRIGVMRDGRLVQVGAPEALYCAPVDRFVAAFFGDVNTVPGIVRSGRVDTPLGNFETPDMQDGAPVEVVIRPEAFSLRPAAEQSVGPGFAKVLASRMLGRTSLVHLCTCTTTGEELHLHARITGPYLPGEGTIMALELDRSRAFVFPAATAK